MAGPTAALAAVGARGFALAGATAACAEPAPAPQAGRSNRLVAYFTRSGNTRVIAGTLQRALSANLFEIRPARPYPDDYEQTVEQARQETERGYEPPLEARVPDLQAYDTVLLGLPIWGGTAPPGHPVVPPSARSVGQDLATLRHARRIRSGQQPRRPELACGEG